ncbi:MAG: hypothetical protein H0W07_00050 [Chloroflexi bacterium]|nr:hypothetical protein [Chloroflexota bacterium]
MKRLAGSQGWESIPEVSYSVYGERGSIDVVGWHAETRTLLIVEVKTAIVDIQELLGTMGRKQRLAAGIARERGWVPARIGSWVVVADTRTNHRRVADHRITLRAAFPNDGFEIARWLRRPSGELHALSFLSVMQDRHRSRR